VHYGIVEATDEPRIFTPYQLCWDVPSPHLEVGEYVIVVWSESAKTPDYRFTTEAG
jgi:hypothetical protein